MSGKCCYLRSSEILWYLPTHSSNRCCTRTHSLDFGRREESSITSFSSRPKTV
ncbi:hypothetical protein Ga0080574_TMP2405 [Salipiger abyssi]|uniref:Uncharacterized protein n=1 Tax=Salipiger abyssi TaxID=1250539 RepID=A0A1P8UTK6_9RHOB|nr:hypothetical protein Ga0080574_TMP2405 [Salipiger abyssi]